MKKTTFYRIRMAVSIFVMAAVCWRPIAADAAFRYEHDPMDNPKAAQDIIEDENAVYGYSPNPSSQRLGAYASYDWSDEATVANAQVDRLKYHANFGELYQMVKDMSAAGESTEEIARAVSARRNEIRLESYKDDPVGLEKVKKGNLNAYGHEEGPAPDDLFEEYGSWNMVIEKVLSSNPGMDACLGLYDLYYDTYGLTEGSQASDATFTYEVISGDCLWKIAEKQLNSGKRWSEIYELNKDTVNDQHVIYPGQKLILPAA